MQWANRKQRLELYLNDYLRGRVSGPSKIFLHCIFVLPALAFYLIGRARNVLYDKRLLPVHRANCTVISIGNLTVGGTGKTPFTLYLAEQLEASGPVAILTRGYRSKAEKREPPILVCPEHSASEVGDEALIYARRLQNALVYSGRNRSKAIRMAEKKGARWMLLDDGFQHRKVHRDLDLLILGASDALGNGKTLPMGPLREGLPSLRRATHLLVRGGSLPSEVLKKIRTYTQAPILEISTRLGKIFDLNGGEVALNSKDKGVAWCGIAKPQSFWESLKEAGIETVKTISFPDHISPSPESLENICLQAKQLGASFLICTEKDAVKLGTPPLSLPLYWVKMNLDMKGGRSKLNNILSNSSK